MPSLRWTPQPYSACLGKKEVVTAQSKKMVVGSDTEFTRYKSVTSMPSYLVVEYLYFLLMQTLAFRLGWLEVSTASAKKCNGNRCHTLFGRGPAIGILSFDCKGLGGPATNIN